MDSPTASGIIIPLLTFVFYVKTVLFPSREQELLAFGARFGSHNVNRNRRSVTSIFNEYAGPYYTRRAYRMDAQSFCKLHQLLEPSLKNKKRKRGRPPNNDIPAN